MIDMKRNAELKGPTPELFVSVVEFVKRRTKADCRGLVKHFNGYDISALNGALGNLVTAGYLTSAPEDNSVVYRIGKKGTPTEKQILDTFGKEYFEPITEGATA